MLESLKTSSGAITMAIGIAAFSAKSKAANLLMDNFDSYADTAAFTAAWPVVGAQPTGTLSTTQIVSAPSSIMIDAPANATAQRNGAVFTESGNPAPDNIVVFSFDFYDSNASLNPYRQHANLQDSASPSGYGQLISMGLNNNQLSTANGGNYYMARILGYTPAGLPDRISNSTKRGRRSAPPAGTISKSRSVTQISNSMWTISCRKPSPKQELSAVMM